VSDYLWDGKGERDPEVERLERALRPLRFEPRPLPPVALPPRRRGSAFGGGFVTLAAAASFVVALAGAWHAARPAWRVQRLAGAPRVGEAVVADKAQLRVGDWLTTDSASQAQIEIGLIGDVIVDPGSRLGLVDAGRRDHRLTMPKGVLHARIWAPPGSFFVETPSAVAVDLGCAYTLTVEEDGSGLVEVESGWVGFDFNGRESFIPQGAVCRTRPGLGPGTPHYHDASERLTRALAELDFGSDPSLRVPALEAVLAEARRDDAVTLWHLLARSDAAERGRVYDRMADLVPPPKGLTREGVLRGDKAMLDAWWNELGLESAAWWRLWKQPPPPQAR
jgi:hypothetical protein